MGVVRLYSKAVKDLWPRQATAAAVESVRKMIGDGAVPAATPVGHLSDEQLGSLLSAGTCSCIATRAEQAVDEGRAAIEVRIRNTGDEPLPWDAGAVETILPELGAMVGVDWNAAVLEWPKDTMLLFLCEAYRLISEAITARKRGASSLRRRRGTTLFSGDALLDFGSSCLRRLDWMCDPTHERQMRDIFERGHLFEDMVRGNLIGASSCFARSEKLGFSTFNGALRGHCGIRRRD